MLLTAQTLVQLSAWNDPIGVLSVYSGRSVATANDRPTAPIELKEQSREIMRGARESLPREQWTALQGRLDELGPRFEELVDPARPGRGRALFAAVSGERVEAVTLQLELPTRVVFQKSPFLVPLVAALDEGRASGLVVVQRDGVRVFEWRLGELEAVAEHLFRPNDDEWRHARGPANPNPARGQQTATHVERFERRVVANRERFLRTVAAALAEEVHGRGWDRIALFGDARLGRPLLEAWPARNDDVEVLVDERIIDDAATETLSTHATTLLHAAQRRRELELVRRAREMSLARGRGATGLAPVLDALNQGRVDHLLFDADRSFSGFVAAGGELFVEPAANELPPGVEVRHEAYLIEHMIRRALATSARLTPVEDIAARELATDEGVAAMLRW